MKVFKKQFGFVSNEVMVGMILVLSAGLYTLSKSDVAAAKTDEQILVDQVKMIVEAGRALAKTLPDRFESQTIEMMSERELVPKKWGDGSKANPHGGGYDLSGSSVTELVIEASELRPTLCQNGAEKINANYDATCSGDTLTITAR